MAKKAGKETKVAIISRESDEKTLDVRMLEEELRERGVRVRVLSKLLTKDRSLRRAIGYAGQLIKQEIAILGSDVTVLDTYCIPASMLPHRHGTKVVQMWHALGAVKKFGWQTVGKPDGASERTASMMRMHAGYDYVICPSDETAKYYTEAFRTSKDRMVRFGLPRIDYIKKVTRGPEAKRARERVLARYPKLTEESKKTLLYAPTFRRGSLPDIKGLADALDPDHYNILVKLHPLYSHGGRVLRDNILYDEHFLTYDLMAAADIVVSDYSALVIESALAGKPLYLYTYDRDEYERTTGLNVKPEEEPIGKYSISEAAELARAIEQPYDYDALEEFGRKYIEIEEAWEDSGPLEEDGAVLDENRCTKMLADFILNLK